MDNCEVCQEQVAKKYCNFCEMKFCPSCLSFVHSEKFKVDKKFHLENLTDYIPNGKLTKEEEIIQKIKKELLERSKKEFPKFEQEFTLILKDDIDVLDLSNLKIDDDFVILLFKCLEFNHSLKILDLYGNQISDKSVEFLTQSLLKNDTLEDLYLSSNTFYFNF